MVQHLPGVVEDGAIGGLNNLLQALAFILGSGDQFVQVVHIGLQVLSVVERQCLVADDRGQGLVGEFNILKHNTYSTIIIFVPILGYLLYSV